MAIATERLTYQQYMAEEEIRKRYEIIDGVRVFMTNPIIEHQKVRGNVYTEIRMWRQQSRAGEVILAPCDILIQRSPLRTRQPDVLFISYERLGTRNLNDPAPLEPAPELVVEILSPSNTRTALNDKLADYARVGVQECWFANRALQTVELLRLSAAGAETAAVCRLGETVESLAFPGLTVAVADVFAA